ALTKVLGDPASDPGTTDSVDWHPTPSELGQADEIDDSEATYASDYPDEESQQTSADADVTDTERQHWSAARSRREARRQQLDERRKARRGGAALALGYLLVATAFTMSFLQLHGLQAALLASGALTLLFLLMCRKLMVANRRIDSLIQSQQGAGSDIQECLHYLVESQQRQEERPPAQGEELERVLMVLQRQSDKVNNLSKALKMYGKPLMEIANQSATTSEQLNDLRSDIQTVTEHQQQSSSVDLEPVQMVLDKLSSDISFQFQKLAEQAPDNSGLQQQLTRLEASVQAMSQRQDDGEVRRGLMRLEDSSKTLSDKVAALAKAETVSEESGKIERQLDLATGKLDKSMEQLRTQQISALEEAIADVQRELTGMATSIAYIQQSLKNAPSEQPAPRQKSGGRKGNSSGAKAKKGQDNAKAKNSSDSSTSDDPSDAATGAAQNRTGARASAGKSVLASIAKLKNMKK
ncbi:MAG: hypothetical protein VYE77_00250, partial [Planctomycetota bacterium]|nr:hypothetical protein [Planctomycetota bacterium]